MLDTAASNAASGSVVSVASATTHVMSWPALAALRSAMATSSGVRSTPVTTAPRAAAASAALPVPQARSTTCAAVKRPAALRRRATVSPAMTAMRSATDS